MKGGYGDAYYMHRISFVRRFKGMEKPTRDTESKSVRIDSDFSQWDGTGVAYREYTGDVFPRSFRAYDAIGRYENHTGRNEFSCLKVASDDENLYFYARFEKAITFAPDDKPILLFLNGQNENAARWCEYDRMISIGKDGKRPCLPAPKTARIGGRSCAPCPALSEKTACICKFRKSGSGFIPMTFRSNSNGRITVWRTTLRTFMSTETPRRAED